MVSDSMPTKPEPSMQFLFVVTLVALGMTISAGAVCSNPIWAIISGSVFLGIQMAYVSHASMETGGTAEAFFMNIEADKVRNAVILSLGVSAVSFLVYVVMTFEATCYESQIPLHQSIPLKIIFALLLLWRPIVPGNTVTHSRALALMVLFVCISACWVVAAASFENTSHWLWWPAIHAVVVDTGIYSVLLVHYASSDTLNNLNSSV